MPLNLENLFDMAAMEVGGEHASGGNAQVRWKNVTFTLGKSYPQKRKLDKIDHEKQIWVYRPIATAAWGTNRTVAVKYNNTSGAAASVTIPAQIPMLYGDHGTLGIGTFRAPAFFVNVTRRPNIVDSSGTITRGADIFIPSSNNTNVYLEQMANYGFAGTANDTFLNSTNCSGSGQTSEWQPYYTTRGSYSVLGMPGSKAILSGVSFKLEAWGQKKRPTRYQVALVQFDERVAPEFNSRGATEQYLTYPQSTDQNQFWTEFMRGKMWHPWSVGYGPQKYLKILASDSFDIEPTNNTDNDGDPQCVMKRYYFQLNRMCHFNWGGDNYSDPAVDGPGINNVNCEITHCDVDPKARLYVMVYASNYYKQTMTSAGTVNADYVPCCAFDCRTIWTMAT